MNSFSLSLARSRSRSTASGASFLNNSFTRRIHQISSPISSSPSSRSTSSIVSLPSVGHRFLHISPVEKKNYGKKYPYKVVPLSSLPVQKPRTPSKPHLLPLNLESRDKANKYISSYLRFERGRIPGIYFSRIGGTEQKKLISVNLTDFQHYWNHFHEVLHTRVFELYIDSSEIPLLAVLKKVDVHGITNQFQNVTFMEFQENKPFRLNVPIVLEGESKNLAMISETATLGVNRHFADIVYTGPSSGIPQAFCLDVQHLMPGQSVRMQDLVLPDSCRLFQPGKLQPVVGLFIREAKEEEPEPEPVKAGSPVAAAAKPAASDKAADAKKGDDKAAAGAGAEKEKAAPKKK